MVQAFSVKRNGLLVHYRNRAQEVRSIADNYTDPARKTLLDIAAMYERLAADERRESRVLYLHESSRDGR